MRNKRHLKRQAANIGKDGSRKCEEGEGYEWLGRAAGMVGWGEDALAKSEGAAWPGAKSEFSPGTDRNQAGTRQEGNWKELLTRYSKLPRRDHHNFSHGQRDGLAQ